MDDSQIIDLYWARQGSAISETNKKYGRYLFSIANHILARLALKKHRGNIAQKRGGTEADLSLEELSDCIPAGQTIDEQLNSRELTDILNRFLSELPALQQQVFVRRYWYCESIAEIAQSFSWTESKAKMLLLRLREKLRQQLTKEGIFL